MMAGPAATHSGGEGFGTDPAAFCARCQDHPERALAWLDDLLLHGVGQFGVLVAVAEGSPYGDADRVGHDLSDLAQAIEKVAAQITGSD